MPQQIYEVELDGKIYEIEGNRPPTEAEARQALQSYIPAEEEEPLQAISDDEPDTYIGGFLKGLGEGVAGGAKGFAKGLARSPLDLVQGIHGLLTTNPMTSLSNMAKSVGRIPGAVQSAAVDPEGWGKSVGSLTGQQMIGMGTPAAFPKIGRGLGRSLEAAGSHPFAWQLAGAHEMMSGRLPTGAALAAAPEVLTKTGGALQKAFAKKPPTSKPLPPPTRTSTGFSTEGSLSSGSMQELLSRGVRIPSSSRPSTQPGISTVPFRTMEELLSADLQGGAGFPKAPTPPPPAQPILIGGQTIYPNNPLYQKLAEALKSAREYTPGAPVAPMPEAPVAFAPKAPVAPTFQAPAPAPSSTLPQSLEEALFSPPVSGPLPRVIKWKEGKGPSERTAQTYRQELGSRDAASRLKVSKDDIKRLAPGESRLPEAVRRTIDQRLSTFKTTAERQAYLDAAPNALTKEYIQFRLNQGGS